MLELFTEFSSQFSWLEYLVEIGLAILAALFHRGFGMRRLRGRARMQRTVLHDLILVVLDKALAPILLLAVLAASLNLFPDLSQTGDAQYQRLGPPRDSAIRLFYVGATRAREMLYICQRDSALPISI